MKKVAILVETSRAYGRGLLRGISRFNRERRCWSTYFQPQGLGDPPPPWLRTWKGDGIIARIETRQQAECVTAVGLPTVNLRSSLGNLKIPFIGSDNLKVADLGAQHLLERGYRHFGYCGFARKDLESFRVRGEHFEKLITEAGFSC